MKYHGQRSSTSNLRPIRIASNSIYSPPLSPKGLFAHLLPAARTSSILLLAVKAIHALAVIKISTTVGTIFHKSPTHS